VGLIAAAARGNAAGASKYRYLRAFDITFAETGKPGETFGTPGRRHFSTRKLPITKASMPELKNVRNASVGV
jgi:hypothetical protein